MLFIIIFLQCPYSTRPRFVKIFAIAFATMESIAGFCIYQAPRVAIALRFFFSSRGKSDWLFLKKSVLKIKMMTPLDWQKWFDKELNSRNFLGLFNSLIQLSESDNCKNDCMEVGNYLIDDPIFQKINQGKYGITFHGTFEPTAENNVDDCIIKVIPYNSQKLFNIAFNEYRMQKEAFFSAPLAVAKAHKKKDCNPECLRPDQGLFQIVMEKLDKTFNQVCLEEIVGQLDDEMLLLRDLEQIINKFNQLLEGGFIHQDAHTDNVMRELSRETVGNSYKIIDFGYAMHVEKKEIPLLKNIDSFFFLIRALVDIDDFDSNWFHRKFKNPVFLKKLTDLIIKTTPSKFTQKRLARVDDRCMSGTKDSWITDFDKKFKSTILFQELYKKNNELHKRRS